MTLGRTASNAIKIKTDDGLRAVECDCCVPPPDWAFSIGFIKVESSVEITKCATRDFIIKALEQHYSVEGCGPWCINNDPLWDCYAYTPPVVCRWATGINVTEPKQTASRCEDGQLVQTSYGFDYSARYTEDGFETNNANTFNPYIKKNHSQSKCSFADERTGNLSILGADIHSFPSCQSTENEKTLGAFEVFDLTSCEVENEDYEIKSVDGSTSSFIFSKESDNSFLQKPLANFPSFPAYSSELCEQICYGPPDDQFCEVGVVLLPESAESAYFVAIQGPAADTGSEEPCAELVSIVSGIKTNFKIIHNVSPTKYLKVWIKRGKININTGDFLSSFIETYVCTPQKFNSNPQTNIYPECAAFYSAEYSLDLEIPTIETLKSVGIENDYFIGRADEYAYILKYSFVADYEPPTTGTGINERCDGFCNGYPPTPATP